MTLEPGPKTKQLIAMLRDAAARLRALGHDHWGEWLEESADALARNQIGGLAHYRSAFGGMGSLSDVIKPAELDQALSRMWALADEIEREAELV